MNPRSAIGFLAIVMILALGGCQNINITDDTTSPTGPSAPTLQSAVAGDGMVTLTWTAVSGVTSYTAYWKAGSTLTKENADGHEADLTDTTLAIAGLTNGTLYAFMVTASDSTGESAPSGILTATPTPPDYGTIGALTVIRTTTDPWGSQSFTVTVPSQTSNSTAISGAVIVYTTDGSTPSRTVGTALSGTTLTLTSSASGLKFMAYVTVWPETSDSPVYDYGSVQVIDMYLILHHIAGGTYTLWKNGSTVTLGGSTPCPLEVTLSGGHVYVAGAYNNGTVNNPCYWLDGGTPVPLYTATVHNYAQWIAVDSSGIVYVAGKNESNDACFWKDNKGSITEQVLHSDATYSSTAYAIYLSGTTVYAGGEVQQHSTVGSGFDYFKAATWIFTGSVSESLIGYEPTGDGATNDSQVSAIGYDGAHVLSAGSQAPAAGGASELASAWQDVNIEWDFSSAWDLGKGCFAGNTLYFTGTIPGATESAVFWRVTSGVSTPNVTETNLYSSSAPHKTNAKGICVAGGNIYICGQDNNTDPAYWVNDKDHKTILQSLSGYEATSIAVDVK